jgi:hypothetical protein
MHGGLPFPKFVYEVGFATDVGEAEVAPEIRVSKLGVVESQ